MADTVTLLDFPQATEIQDGDLLYAVRGTGTDRDITIPGSVLKSYLGETLITLTTTGSIDLDNYKTNVLILCEPIADMSLTITGALPGGNKALIFNKSAFKLTLSIISTAPELYEGEYAQYFSDVTAMNLLSITRVTDESATYSAATTYAQGDVVNYFGLQYVSLENSNTGNDPVFDLDNWMPVPGIRELLENFQKGNAIEAGVHRIHDPRDATYYRDFFSLGKHKIGSRIIEAYGVHMGGVQVTGNADLVSILRVGELDEYHYIDKFAPDSVGTRTLLDYRGTVSRAGDETGGNTEDVGVRQEDAMQRITGVSDFDTPVTSGGSNGVFSESGTGASLGHASGGNPNLLTFDSSGSTSPNPAKTNDRETRVKAHTKGVPYIIVLKAV